MHYWRVLKGFIFNVAHCDLSPAAAWLCAALCFSDMKPGPFRRALQGKRWWEGSKGSLWGILMSHPGPSLSHLLQCAGCKALEQVGLNPGTQCETLTRSISETISPGPLNKIKYCHAVSCQAKLSSVSTLWGNIYLVSPQRVYRFMQDADL